MLLPLVTAAGELKLLDPAAPATPALIADTGLDAPGSFAIGAPWSKFPYTSVLPVFTGTYNAAGNTVSDAHFRHLIYVKQGRIYRVDLQQGNSHTPAQVSSAADVCYVANYALDYANPLNTLVEAFTAGTDATCYSDDDEVSFMPLGSSAAQSGTSLGGTPDILESSLATDGSLAYVLIEDDAAGTLRRYDASLANPVDALAREPGTFIFGAPDQDRTTIYFVAQPAGETVSHLYRYNVATNTLTSVYTSGSSSAYIPSRADGSYLYFVDGNVVRRVAHNSATPQILHTAAATMSFQDLYLTANRIVMQGYDYSSGLSGISTLPKAGSANLTTLEDPSTLPMAIYETAGSRVYYLTGDPNAGSGAAVEVLEDGSGKQTFISGGWGGELWNTQINIGAVDAEIDAKTMLLGQANANGVVTVKAIDAASGAEGATLGTVPDAISAWSFGYGRYALSSVEVDRGGATDFDVYFADAAMAGSLRAVAATSDADDAAVY